MWEGENLKSCLAGKKEQARNQLGWTPNVAELLSCPNGPVSGKSTAQLQKPPSLRKQTRFPSEMGISSRRGSLAICRQRGLLLPCYKNTPNERSPGGCQFPIFFFFVKTSGINNGTGSHLQQAAPGGTCQWLGQDQVLSPSLVIWYCHFLCLPQIPGPFFFGWGTDVHPQAGHPGPGT